MALGCSFSKVFLDLTFLSPQQCLCGDLNLWVNDGLVPSITSQSLLAHWSWILFFSWWAFSRRSRFFLYCICLVCGCIPIASKSQNSDYFLSNALFFDMSFVDCILMVCVWVYVKLSCFKFESDALCTVPERTQPTLVWGTVGPLSIRLIVPERKWAQFDIKGGGNVRRFIESRNEQVRSTRLGVPGYYKDMSIWENSS